MFWNSDFLKVTPCHIDVLLQSPETKLSDILFEEDILQEVKTSNVILNSFLLRPEILNELVDNITQLTEEDCCEKILYSRVHAAYISCEILTACSAEIFDALLQNPNSLNKIISSLTRHPLTTTSDITKVVPQKAALISKLISNIHSQAPADLSCHVTKNLETFKELIQVLVDNIDISGSFEILSTLINRTNPSELRYVFCEILSKLNFVNSLINVMTLSNAEDKQRNACQLLCDIIVIGRQEAFEQANAAPTAQDMLAEILESKEAVKLMLDQMFPQKSVDDHHGEQLTEAQEDEGEGADQGDISATVTAPNTTGIVCGMKVLQALVEQKRVNKNNQRQNMSDFVQKTIEKIQDEIAKSLIKFHELLLNPPKQEPIKTTFGVIQKPLGYVRLEVIILIRALLSTNTPVIISELVKHKTMKVIIDLFIEYSWNNLLHTQVEQALCLIIRNCRHDEDIRYQIDMQKHKTNNIPNHVENNLENHIENSLSIHAENNLVNHAESREDHQESLENNVANHTENNSKHQTEINSESRVEDTFVGNNGNNYDHSTSSENNDEKISTTEDASRALLSQLLNECDLIGRLLLPIRNGEQANFGHIIEMINSIAINCDLDTIQGYLNEMKEKRPELYDRWTTFINVDVASFKAISSYFELPTADNQIDDGRMPYTYTLRHRDEKIRDGRHVRPDLDLQTNLLDDSVLNSLGLVDDHQLIAYLSFTKETVIPSINVDVLPKSGRSAKNNNC